MENGQKTKEESQPSTSALPAEPRNGTIKIYENPARTFTRPYSAKNITIYKENDTFYTGHRVPVSNHRYKTLDVLMDDLNRTMYLPYGVRTITTPMGRTIITSLDQFQHLGKYVASSSNPPKGVDLEKIQEKYSASLRRNPQRTTAGGQSYWVSYENFSF
ncbi:Doublecortin domain-containing protein [Caenorhabditis elegans]|uniref:Doublecortin domain-containing protein n=1 Tax=Caenorhabditis elegans TaxID=6239 RepID=Q1NZ32_CAEEL|nr:Doublecortin domain-containing protein [Caenorhabditis elegans]CCD66290.2 Doublecortin domain-containing protein [Caenorhabditis elegans]|eukprot:NP_491601.4 Uncharacterized protein CELE_F27C1.13 [Caenorhabditis elegans]